MALGAHPLILALETATREVSAALLRGAELLIEERGDPARPAAELLLSLVDQALAGAGVRLADVEAFAVSIGPGSFTSLRIGLATLKGLAFGTGRPAVAVPTLEALAHAAPAGVPAVAPVLDARRGELYAAVYRPAAEGFELAVPEGVFSPEELVPHLPERCAVVGEGVAVCGERLRALAAAEISLLGPPACPPRAAHVGRIAARALARGEGRPAGDLVPRYLRRAEAEVVRTGVRFERG